MDAAATESLELETVNLKDEAQPQNNAAAPEEKELSRTNHKFQCICLTAFFFPFLKFFFVHLFQR